MTTITPLTAADHLEWLQLWRAYIEFYESTVSDEVTASSFARLVSGDGMHGAIARDADGRAVGIVHWLQHPATWDLSTYTYLEDLFVAPDTRGGGVGRALISHVREWAAQHGSSKVYWLTASSNDTARRLYDSITGGTTGFVHYEVPREG